jgi:tetratricopeptide (TPR) repeat protein
MSFAARYRLDGVPVFCAYYMSYQKCDILSLEIVAKDTYVLSGVSKAIENERSKSMGETVTLSFHALDDNSYEVRVRDSWSGYTTSGKFVPPYTTRQVNAQQKKLENAESSDQKLKEIGQHLFAALCGLHPSVPLDRKVAKPSVQAVLQTVIHRTLTRRGTVALSLLFGPGCDEFIRYPWELLHNGDLFLIISGIFTLSRSLQLVDAPVGSPLPVHPPLRILYIGSSPQNLPPLEIEQSFQAMEQALGRLIDDGQVILDRLNPPTYSNLVSYFTSYGGVGLFDDNDTTVPCYVVHFDGHGIHGRLCPNDDCGAMNAADAKRCSGCEESLRDVGPQTYLSFCDEDNMNCFVDAQSLRHLLVSSDIRLAVFAACETATVTTRSAVKRQQQRTAIDATLATALVTGQVPAVVAMPFSLQDELSPTFMSHFYEALFNKQTLEEALSRARQAMVSTLSKSWFVPVLYRLVAEGEEGPVALLADSKARSGRMHPLAHLGPPSAFVGRTRELGDMDVLLESAASGKQRADVPRRLHLSAGCRRIALTGYAGMGKSALAYEAIRRNRDKFPGGIIGITLRDGKSFHDALLEILNALPNPIPDRKVLLADGKQRAQFIRTTLLSLAKRELPSLLLLDNFEEMKDHTELEAWLQFLCSLPEEVTVIVTSRSNPGHMVVGGSSSCRWYEYSVEKMTNTDLLDLFIELAASSGLGRRIQLDHEKQQAILLEICELLDGYPLGAELIFGAARPIGGQTYTPAAATRSLEEVRDDLCKTPLPGILAVLDVSYHRLTPPARLLLSYLAAFKLPFTHEQINMLVKPEKLAVAPEILAISDEIAQLVKKAVETEEVASFAALARQWGAARDELVRASFMQFNGQLYSIHSQIRHFALARLPIEEQRRIHRVVATYYCNLPSPNADEWFEAFEHLEAAAESDDMQEAIRVAIRAALALEGSSYARELQAILRRASGYASRLNDITGEAEIQCRLGAILRLMGQYAEAEFCFKSSLSILRKEKKSELMAWALYELTVLCCDIGDFKQAHSYAQEALELFQVVDSARGNAYINMMLGQIRYGQASYADAKEHFDLASAGFIRLHDRVGRALTSGNRGKMHEALGEYGHALLMYEESLRLFRELKRPIDQAWIQVYKSGVYVYQGKWDQAKTLCDEALMQFQQLGVQRGEAWIARVMGDLALKKQDLDLARSYYERASELFSTVGDLVDQATVFNALGQVSLKEHAALDAKGYFGQALETANRYGARHIKASALRGLGEVGSNLRQCEEAVRSYREAFAIFFDINSCAECAQLLYDLGVLYESQQMYQEALKTWYQALPLDCYLEESRRSDLREKIERLKQ